MALSTAPIMSVTTGNHIVGEIPKISNEESPVKVVGVA
jgi:hypothetical protein